MQTLKDMKSSLDWFKQRKPNSTLIELYTLAINKKAIINLDWRWRMSYNNKFYSANNVYELVNVLKGISEGEYI